MLYWYKSTNTDAERPHLVTRTSMKRMTPRTLMRRRKRDGEGRRKVGGGEDEDEDVGMEEEGGRATDGSQNTGAGTFVVRLYQ